MKNRIRALLQEIPAFLPHAIRTSRLPFPGDVTWLWRWIFCVLALAGVFGIAMALLDNGTSFTLERFAARAGVRIDAKDARWTVFPPGLAASRVALHSAGMTVEMGATRLIFGLAWPVLPTVRVHASLLGGTVDADITPSGWSRPQSVHIDARWKHLDARALQRLWNDKAGIPLFEVLRGRVTGAIAAAVPVTNLWGGTGTLTVDVEDLESTVALPMLTFEKLENMLGRVSLRWQDGDIRVEEVRLTNALLRLDCQGTVNAKQAAAMRLRVRISIAPEHLRLALLPPRSQAAFAIGQPVDVLLHGPLGKPAFSLATAPPTAPGEVRP